MRRYAGDPRWIRARYAGRCAGCGEAFERGARVLYVPATRDVLVGSCAERAAGQFAAAAEDEAAFGGGLC